MIISILFLSLIFDIWSQMSMILIEKIDHYLPVIFQLVFPLIKFPWKQKIDRHFLKTKIWSNFIENKNLIEFPRKQKFDQISLKTKNEFISFLYVLTKRLLWYKLKKIDQIFHIVSITRGGFGVFYTVGDVLGLLVRK